MIGLTFEIEPFPDKEIVGFLDTELTRATREAVSLLASSAINLVPVDTGFLQDSIRAPAVRGTFSRDSLSGEIQATAPYAGFVEFGVEPGIRQRQGGPLFTHKGQEPQPFMQESIDLSIDALTTMFSRAVDIGFQRAA